MDEASQQLALDALTKLVGVAGFNGNQANIHPLGAAKRGSGGFGYAHARTTALLGI
jgi:hypothetical protein